MRLQLIAAIAIAAPATGRADPEVAASARIGVYADSDHTTVTTTSVAASASPTAALRLGAQYLADAVSSASIDVVSSATGRIHELRHEVTTTARYQRGDHALGAAYLYSVEHDWTSHTLAIDANRDLAQHAVTIGVAVTGGINAIGKVGDPDLRRRLVTGGGDASVTVAASRRDLVHLDLGVALLQGYQASPYRFAVYDDLRAVFETVPRARLRQVIALRWNHQLFADSALRMQVRGYRDSWGILSITGAAAYVVGLGAFDLDMHVRGYAQRGARFYRATYAAPMRYMTADRELSRFVDGFAGAGVAWRRDADDGGALRIDLKVDGFAFAFPEFPAMPSRTGMIVELGVALSR